MMASLVIATLALVGQAFEAEMPRVAVAPFDAGEARKYQRTWAEHEGVPLEVTNSIGLKLILIPPGEFLMGTTDEEKVEIERLLKQYAGANSQWLREEHPPRKVRITSSFYLSVCEITQKEYKRVMGSNPSVFSSDGASPEAELFADVTGMDTSHFPVENVTWDEAVEFCQRLSSLAEERHAGRMYRLPREAEWEYACRAGTISPFHFGNAVNGQQANCDGTQPYGTSMKGQNLERTTRIASYPPNAFGLYDMHGNVAEWCQDWLGPYTAGEIDDPVGVTTGSRRVTRGGYWLCPGFGCRSAHRGGSAPANRAGNLGFRVAVYLLREKVRSGGDESEEHRE
jgi:formylglycine-generating enzyme required for sulfatase activity